MFSSVRAPVGKLKVSSKIVKIFIQFFLLFILFQVFLQRNDQSLYLSRQRYLVSSGMHCSLIV